MTEPLIIEGQSRLIRAEVPKTCGTCAFGHDFREAQLQPIVANAVECYGVPPTPVIMGQGPGGAAVGLMRPRIAKTEPACALWALKPPAIEQPK